MVAHLHVPPRLGQAAAREKTLGVALGRGPHSVGDVGQHPARHRGTALAALAQLGGELRRRAELSLNGVSDQLGDLGGRPQAAGRVEARPRHGGQRYAVA